MHDDQSNRVFVMRHGLRLQEASERRFGDLDTIIEDMRAQGNVPSAIITSPVERARMSADYLGQAFGIQPSENYRARQDYARSPEWSILAFQAEPGTLIVTHWPNLKVLLKEYSGIQEPWDEGRTGYTVIDRKAFVETYRFLVPKA